MAKFALVCVLLIFAAFAAIEAAPESKCGPWEAYYERCAPCGADCSGGEIPCPAGVCNKGCQCIPGASRIDGKCVKTLNCGQAPKGAQN